MGQHSSHVRLCIKIGLQLDFHIDRVPLAHHCAYWTVVIIARELTDSIGKWRWECVLVTKSHRLIRRRRATEES
jgi:hypothetical protein